MKRSLGIFILLLIHAISYAQVSINGRVLDTEGKSITDVIVKVVYEGKTLAFTTTKADGSFSMEVKDSKQKNVSVTFSHISYETDSKNLILSTKKGNVELNMVLIGKNVSLKEVKVRVSRVRQSGDTLSFNLTSFLGKNDVTLEDGIKRLPGVNVNENGQISYMGRPISQFNIEDLNLLNGKYNLATRNITADNVKTVQFIRNFHSRKVDGGKPSDNVAMNIKLADKAKLKPFGSEEGGVGYMEEGRDELQMMLGLTGMLFTDKFQVLGTVKTGNYKNYALSDLNDHFGNSNISSIVTSLFGRFSAGRPPMGDYEHQRNAIISLNGIQKVDSFTTIRVNSDYAYSNITNDVSQSTTYYNGSDYIVISENATPFTMYHKPNIMLDYETNKKDLYLRNMLKINALFDKNNGDILFNSSAVSGTDHNVEQRRKSTTIGIDNQFNYYRKTEGNWLGEIVSDISFNTTPKLNLFFNKAGETYGQTAQSTSFISNTSTTFGYTFDSSLELSVSLRLFAGYDFVETNRSMTGDINKIDGWKIIPSLAPMVFFKSKNKKINSFFGVPLEWKKLLYRNYSYSKITTNPWVKLEYIQNTNNKFSLNSSYGTNIGDMTSLLTDSMQTNYRSVYAASGVIGESTTFQSSLSWDLSFPFQYISFYTEISHYVNRKNTLSSQNINGIDISNSFLLINNKATGSGGKLSVSKNIPVLVSKFTLDASCGFGKVIQAVKEKQIKVKNNNYSISGKMDITPLEWVELNYRISFSKNKTRYDGYNSAIESLSHSGAIHLFPISQLDITLNYNNVRQQISEDGYKNMSLFNIFVQYKLKRCILNLDISNIFNQRSYSYSIFDGINTYSYNYRLCGRTAMLKINFNF